MSTLHRDNERNERLVVFTKGAPDILLARCSRELVGEDPRPLRPERRGDRATTDALADRPFDAGVAITRLPNDSPAASSSAGVGETSSETSSSRGSSG